MTTTKCRFCSKEAVEGPGTTVQVLDQYPTRMSPSGHAYRSISPTKTRVLVHTTCLEETERWIELAKLRADKDRLEVVLDLGGQSDSAEARKWVEIAQQGLEDVSAKIAQLTEMDR